MSMETYGRPRFPWLSLLLLLILAPLVVLAWAWWLWPRGERPLLDSGYEPRAITPRGDLMEIEKAQIQIYDQGRRSAAFINIKTLRRDFFQQTHEVHEGTGSGIVWDKQGHVVTNFHVIQNANLAQVTLADQSSWAARVVGVAPDSDLAVLRIDVPEAQLQPVPIGKSRDLQVGQMCFAIGNPFALDQTFSTGVISALQRQIRTNTGAVIDGAIQTDAAINPGNSGGPLLDSAGRLIGVNTAIVSNTGSYAGIGFAIPIDEVNLVVTELIRKGKISRPGLGVGVRDYSMGGTKGLLIVNVMPNGPAEKAGLIPTRFGEGGQVRWGDVIVSVDGDPVRSLLELRAALGKH
ncbi:MAG: S1C family serine protease, partial [Gemmataceae bacterium]